MNLDQVLDSEHEVTHYLSRADVARRLGLKSVRSMSNITLPPPDVIVGNHQGWKVETIDEWNRTRPGRGRWGQRGEDLD